MKCPKCPSVELAKISGIGPIGLARAPMRCPRCGGLWLRADDAPRLAEREELLEAAEVPSSEADLRAGRCPGGHGLMSRARVHQGEGFYLERCLECWGVWFDPGEWKRLAEHQLLGGLDRYWDPDWQLGYSRVSQEAETRRWLEERLGTSLFRELHSVAERLRAHPARSEAMAYFERQVRKARGESGSEAE